MTTFEFYDAVYGRYKKATVNREKRTVRFENFLFYDDAALTPDLELWLHTKTEMEVVFS
ncbi:hypothetical protein V7128_05860 [Neobacillus vireti]|uniref:hypothetical protein n=1 Tax=Neobacillus vireti TaxID=220686 RepID=UPI002FFFF136